MSGSSTSQGAVRSQAALNGSGAALPATTDAMETVYDGGLKGGWSDWGWAKREVTGPGPAKVDFANWGGWILQNGTLARHDFGALVFRMKAPSGDSEAVGVHLLGPGGEGPDIRLTADHFTRLSGVDAGWEEVRVKMSDLNPQSGPFDRIVIHGVRPCKDEWTLLDRIRLTAGEAGDPSRPPGSTGADPAKARPLAVAIECRERATRISPLIYGIAYNFQAERDEQQWRLGATIRRWGGNPTSRYNWLIHAWNVDMDWFFENLSVPPYTSFLADDAAHDVQSALTIPIGGWVAKDTSSVGFPVEVYGPQERTDPYRANAGNGVAKDGTRLASGPPERTSVAASPAWIRKWVQAIVAADARSGRRSVDQYILDNEPNLWSSTHRDVRSAPLTYDELVERTIAYGSAIRSADPGAVIAGPAEWGWMNYLYSAKDTENGFAKADRKAHGDVPLVEYYLRKLRDYEIRTGIRVLDVLDLHFYPASVDDPKMAAKEKDAVRIRSTRGLWDPDYVDESWIHEKIRLLPRMKEWIDRNYPGRGISIGEWNFGGENSMAGGLAAGEALGRFGQYGVTSAYYWCFPPAGSQAMQAFLAYRDYDGRGGRFLDWSIPVKLAASAPASVFASRDAAGEHVVAVALNLSPDAPLSAHFDVTDCGAVRTQRAFVFADRATPPAFAAEDATVRGDAGGVDQILPPYSITVLDIHLTSARAGRSIGSDP
ncbi:MAG: glycoside hydrolase family 44 protein [Polyangiaceae bacterium]|jgi:hypothetical protein